MRALICSFSSPGFLFPLVGLACELRRVGHDVAFACSPSAKPILEAEGLCRLPRGEAEGESFILARWGVALGVAMDVKHAEHAARRLGADVLVTHQLCLGALIAAERLDLPLAVLGFATYLWPVRGDDPHSRAGGRRAWRFRETMGLLNQMRGMFGLTGLPVDCSRNPLAGDVCMVRSVPEFEINAEALPPSTRLVGGCQWEPHVDDGALWDEIEADTGRRGGPVVYVQHGRTFRSPSFWPALTEGLGGTQVTVVASVGRMDPKPTAVPDNFFIRDHVPHGAVLRRASAVVCGGNTSVVLAAAAGGRPVILFPAGGETADNAERAVAAGFGIALDPGASRGDDVRRALDELLVSTSAAESARRMAAAFERRRGFSAAARAVESVVV